MTVLRWGICETRINNFHHFCLILWTEQLIKKWSTVQSTAVIIICCSLILMLELLRDTVCVYVSLRVVSMVLSAHLSTAGNLHAVDRSGDLDGAHAAVLAALFPDVLQDLLVVLVVHQLLRHHHVEQAQHLRGHAWVLQPLQPRHLQRHRRLYDGGLQEDGGWEGGTQNSFRSASDSPDSEPQSASCPSLWRLQRMNMLQVIFPLTFHCLHLPLSPAPFVLTASHTEMHVTWRDNTIMLASVRFQIRMVECFFYLFSKSNS